MREVLGAIAVSMAFGSATTITPSIVLADGPRPKDGSDAQAHAPLCRIGETTVLSFQTEAGLRTISLCEGAGSTYMVYRSGRPKHIELQYPRVANTNSWRSFEFAGYSREGGASNDAMGDYTLRFVNRDVVYTVFQSWRVSGSEYRVGVVIEVKGKAVVLKGNADTQIGSLMSLETNKKIKNAW